MTARKLTLEEKIDRAKDGRSQKWIIKKMIEKGCQNLTDTIFSNKKKGHAEFTEQELTVLSEILSINLP
jgi:hypothetical protein